MPKIFRNGLGVSFEEINIKDTLLAHFKDIQHSPEDHNLTYENAQARERTQVLMDLCSERNAIMVGTGDLSELCLGWTTYNGDHMSMYGVNASIPKTLVRYLCKATPFFIPRWRHRSMTSSIPRFPRNFSRPIKKGKSLRRPKTKSGLMNS
jgi:NH3-dependent NAD+ synthetase